MKNWPSSDSAPAYEAPVFPQNVNAGVSPGSSVPCFRRFGLSTRIVHHCCRKRLACSSETQERSCQAHVSYPVPALPDQIVPPRFYGSMLATRAI